MDASPYRRPALPSLDLAALEGLRLDSTRTLSLHLLALFAGLAALNVLYIVSPSTFGTLVLAPFWAALTFLGVKTVNTPRHRARIHVYVADTRRLSRVAMWGSCALMLGLGACAAWASTSLYSYVAFLAFAIGGVIGGGLSLTLVAVGGIVLHLIACVLEQRRLRAELDTLGAIPLTQQISPENVGV